MELLLSLCLLTFIGKTFGEKIDFQERFAEEGSEVMLPCLLKDVNLTHEVFDWKKDDQHEVFLYDNGKHYRNGLTGQDKDFLNRVEIFQDKLQNGNASIFISKTKLTDTGNYSCGFPKRQPSIQPFYIKLVVDCILKDRRGEIPGVCPKPIITNKKTPDGIRVNCSVTVSSKVEMELHDSAGKPQDNPPSTVVSPNLQTFMFPVTKEDEYRCVVKQREHCHQTNSEYTFVQSSGSKNRTEGEKMIKLIVLLLVVVGLLLP